MESIVLGIYLWFKIYFLIDTNAKMWTEITDLVILGRNYWSSCRVTKLFNCNQILVYVADQDQKYINLYTEFFHIQNFTIEISIILIEIFYKEFIDKGHSINLHTPVHHKSSMKSSDLWRGGSTGPKFLSPSWEFQFLGEEGDILVQNTPFWDFNIFPC